MKAAIALFAALLGASISLQANGAGHRAVVDGLVVNLGVISAERALRADGHRDAHPTNPPGGSQHLLVTLDDEKAGRRISDAEVDVAVIDPRGHVENERMLRTQGGGLPDYSELFVFPWSGKYAVQLVVTPASGIELIRTQFVVDHRL